MTWTRTLILTAVLLFTALAAAAALRPSSGDLQQEFAKRRAAVMAQMDSNSVALFVGGTESRRNHDINYPFRQTSDFYYLTGFEEPDAAFMLIPGSETPFVMFVRPSQPAREVWTGRRAGIAGAMNTFGADTAFAIQRLEKLSVAAARGKTTLYLDLNSKAELAAALDSLGPGGAPAERKDLLPSIHEMRLIKSPAEIELLRRSIDITAESQREAMKAAKPGIWEYELEAIIEYTFRRHGSQRPGFPSIVGSGPNSTILHYDSNQRRTRKGDVIVMDIGSEYGYYSADITRTIPVNGKFSDEQREIYEIVLAAQKAAIAKTQPGAGLGEVQRAATDVVKEGLYQLGLITDTQSRWQHRVWLMHGVSHWLGLDTHDAGDYRYRDQRGRILEPGMVFTIEPGIYVGENALKNLPSLLGRFVKEAEMQAFIQKVGPVAEKYKNIGIRIEDDLLVTKSGYELLSKDAPREIRDIEKLMKQKSRFQH